MSEVFNLTSDLDRWRAGERLIARYETRGKAHWLELYTQDRDGGRQIYYWRGPEAGGLWGDMPSDEEAIAELERPGGEISVMKRYYPTIKRVV